MSKVVRFTNDDKIMLFFAVLFGYWYFFVRDKAIKIMGNSKNAPLGIRNNNPLNIRKSSTVWQGEVTPDSAFEKFESIDYGMRAALMLLRSYYTKYGKKTITDIINRWAPPVENNTSAYVLHVEKASGIPKGKILSLDADTFTRIATAMGQMEVGANYAPSLSMWQSVNKQFKII